MPNRFVPGGDHLPRSRSCNPPRSSVRAEGLSGMFPMELPQGGRGRSLRMVRLRPFALRRRTSITELAKFTDANRERSQAVGQPWRMVPLIGRFSRPRPTLRKPVRDPRWASSRSANVGGVGQSRSPKPASRFHCPASSRTRRGGGPARPRDVLRRRQDCLPRFSAPVATETGCRRRLMRRSRCPNAGRKGSNSPSALSARQNSNAASWSCSPRATMRWPFR